MKRETNEQWSLDVRTVRSALPWRRYRWVLIRYIFTDGRGGTDVEVQLFASGYALTRDRAWNKANTTWERHALKEIKKELKP